MKFNIKIFIKYEFDKFRKFQLVPKSRSKRKDGPTFMTLPKIERAECSVIFENTNI